MLCWGGRPGARKPDQGQTSVEGSQWGKVPVKSMGGVPGEGSHLREEVQGLVQVGVHARGRLVGDLDGVLQDALGGSLRSVSFFALAASLEKTDSGRDWGQEEKGIESTCPFHCIIVKDLS